MSIFKNNKRKIALALACASVLGGKNSLAAQNAGRVGGAVASSKKMSNLTKGLIVGGSILGAGLIGYEVLGDTVIDKAPTLLKLFRGRKQGKDEQVTQENMLKIRQKVNESEVFDEGNDELRGLAESFKNSFESIVQKIINHKTNEIWRKVTFVKTKDGNMYTTNEKDTMGLSVQKLMTDKQKREFDSFLMKKFADIFNDKKAINECKKIIGGIEFSTNEEHFEIKIIEDVLTLSNYTFKDNKKGNVFEIEYSLG